MRLQNKTGKGILYMVTVCIAVCMILSLYITMAEAKGSDSSLPRYKYYKTIEVEDGDTLWNIADRYMGSDYKDKKTYIKEVMEMNQLGSENQIYDGQQLTVAYYSTERK